MKPINHETNAIGMWSYLPIDTCKSLNVDLDSTADAFHKNHQGEETYITLVISISVCYYSKLRNAKTLSILMKESSMGCLDMTLLKKRLHHHQIVIALCNSK